MNIDTATTTDAPATGRALAACIRAGVPQQVLIPILPPTHNFNGKGAGKVPAKFDPEKGGWTGLEEWQRGNLSDEIQRAADAAGGNAGVILGSNVGPGQLIAVDIDLNDMPGAVKWRDGIVQAFGRVWGQPLAIRETVPYRALLLLTIPGLAASGTKKRFPLSFKDPAHPDDLPVGIGTIEILTYGQQVVIAGTHPSGNRIQWVDERQEGRRTPAPPPLDGLPTFQDFDTLVGSVVDLLDKLADFGFRYSALSASGINGVAPPIADLAPPSIDDLVDLVSKMPNPAAVDRDIYVSVMRSIAGCRAAVAAAKGALTLQEDLSIGDAAAAWAARWQAPRGQKAGTYEEERAKWDNDWARPQHEYLTGWRQLLGFAQAFGAPAETLLDIAMERAQNEFKADPDAPPVKPGLPPLQVTDPYEGAVAEKLGEILGKSPGLYFRNGPVRLSPRGNGLPPAIEKLTVMSAMREAYRRCRPVDSNGHKVKLEKIIVELAMSEADRWGLRPLAGVTSSPILREGGEIVSKPGYDPITHLYLYDVPTLNVPERPTYGEARAALSKVRHRFRTIPFGDAETKDCPDLGVRVVDTTKPPGMDESSALAILQTAACRASLHLAPGSVINAPGNGAGSGKGLLTCSVSQIAFGYTPSAYTHSGDAKEFDKRLVGAFLEGGPVIYFDNINGEILRSDTLASATTERPTALRALGKSGKITVDSSAWVVLTGNALSVSEDLVRRFITTTLDAKMEDASARPFKGGRDAFLAEIKAQRAELLTACLTIWKWGVQGCEGAPAVEAGRPLGSFEPWCAWVRDPLLALGCQDPVARIRAAKAADPVHLRTVELFETWHRQFGNALMSCAAIGKAGDVANLVMPTGTPWADKVSWQALRPHLETKAGTRAAGAVLERVPDATRGSGAVSYRLTIQDPAAWKEMTEVDPATGAAIATPDRQDSGNVVSFGRGRDARDEFTAEERPGAAKGPVDGH